MMKKRILVALGVPLGLALSASSCNLDTEPLGSLTDQTFYQTEQDFDAATLGPYTTMLNLTYDQFGFGLWNGFLKPDDNAEHRDPNDPNDTFNWTSTNGDFAWVWRTAYTGIMRANVVLDKLPAAARFSDPTKKARYEAEARFMRAWWYFLLARNFGNVPIVTKVPTSVEATMVGNSAPGEVWDLIESDLKFAAQNLPANYGNEKGRATKYSALAYLGKVQIFRAQWFNLPAKYQEAITNLQAVVSSGAFQLVTNYGDNFSENTENNAESLFEIQDTEGDNINSWGTSDTGGRAGHAWNILVSPSCFYGAGGTCAPKAWGMGYGQVEVTPGLDSAFEANDPRKFFTEYSQGEDYGGTVYQSTWSRTGHTPAKYNRPWNPNRYPNNWSGDNLRLLRYSDVLLLLAEAKLLGNNDIAGAAALVNQVRARARASYPFAYGTAAPVGTLPDVPTTGTTLAWFKQYLVHERRVELAFEDTHRYDDLVRWHRAGLINIKTDINFSSKLPEANTNWSTKNLIKPIPQHELDLNPNLHQNIEYGG